MDLIKKILKAKDSVSIIMVLLLITKLLGFIKFRIIAGTFGTSRELDMFWAAFIIPDTLFNILVAGSINAAIIPVFSKTLHKDGEDHLVNLMKTTILCLSGLSIILSIILYVYAYDIGVFIVSSGFIGDFLDVSTTLNVNDLGTFVLLIRIMLLSPILLGISSIITAFLQVHKRFFITTLAPFMYNLGMIIVILFTSKYTNLGVKGLAWSVVFASLLHLLIQLPLAKKFVSIELKNKNLETFSHFKSYLKEVFYMAKLSIPRVLSFISEQFNVAVNTIISFSLTEGALSAYRFALSLYQLPVHIFAGAYAQVSLPDLSEAYTKGNLEKFKSIFSSALKKMLFVILPSVSVILVFRLPIVRLAYGIGEFDWWATVVTSWSLALLSFAIVGQSVVSLVLRALYSIQETKLPLIATLVTIIVNIIASYYFTNFFSHYLDWRPIISQVFSQLGGSLVSETQSFTLTLAELIRDLGIWFTTRNKYDASIGGLSIGLSIAFFVEMSLNLFFLNRKVKVLDKVSVVIPILKMVFNSVLSFVAMYVSYKLLDFSLDTTRTINVILVFLITSGIGVSIYIGLSYFYKVKEVDIITDIFNRLKRGFIAIFSDNSTNN